MHRWYLYDDLDSIYYICHMGVQWNKLKIMIALILCYYVIIISYLIARERSIKLGKPKRGVVRIIIKEHRSS